MSVGDRIILALDVPGSDEALVWARRFQGRVGAFKIGLQLFTAAGPDLVSRVAGEHGPVFLDLKLHDIPNTVAAAVRQARALGVGMITVHALGGTSMLRAASEAATGPSNAPVVPASSRAARDPVSTSAAPRRPLPEEVVARAVSGRAAPLGLTPGGSARPLVLAVTVLTSHDDGSLAEMGITRTVTNEVQALADLAWLAGCDGLVASALEAAALRERLGPDAVIVTPGIRGEDDPRDDQRRTATAREAIAAGADYLVIGRPILAAPDPEAALERILLAMS